MESSDALLAHVETECSLPGCRPDIVLFKPDDTGLAIVECAKEQLTYLANTCRRCGAFLKFFYRSALPGNVEQELLLDVVEEAREVHSIVKRPIRTSFLEPENEYLVRVPTVESLRVIRGIRGPPLR